MEFGYTFRRITGLIERVRLSVSVVAASTLIALLTIGVAHAQVLPSMPQVYQPNAPCPATEVGEFALTGPSGFVGTLFPNRGDGQFHELEANGQALNGLISVRHKYPQRGIWLGLSETVKLPVDVDVVFEGWYLRPSRSEAVSRYQFTGVGGVGTSKDWGKVQADSWFVDAFMLFSWAEGWRAHGWSQINGVRIDVYGRTLEDPDRVDGFVPLPITDSDRMEMSSSMVIPYIGMQVQRENSAYAATFRIIVSPFVIGGVHHEETWGGANGRREEGSITFNRGTFTELFIEAKRKPSDSVSIGGFMKFSAISAFGSGDLEGSLGGGATQTAGYDLIFRKIAYILGGTASIDF